MDITPFRNQASVLQKGINQISLRLAGEMYTIKQSEARLKELALSSSEFRKRLSEVVELVKNQIVRIGANTTFPANMPHNTTRSLNMEVAILNFGCKAIVRLSTTINRTIEKCTEFYKGTCFVHNQCMILTGAQDQYFPVREENLKNLQERLLKGEESISKLEGVSEDAIEIWIIQSSIHKRLLEELLSQNAPKVKEIESQLSKHEVAVHVLEPIEYRVISEESQAWSIFIKTSTGPT